jgi:uncharacterized membrane protein
VQKRLRRPDKRASSFILILLGFLFVILGIVAVLVTVSGVMDHALHFEPLPAIHKYIIGTIVSIGLFAFGFLFLVLGIRD